MLPLVSVSALISDREKLLAAKLSCRNGYSLLGGHVSGNENLEKALKREVKEEADLTVKSAAYFNSYQATKGIYNLVNVSFVVQVEGVPVSLDEGAVEWIEARKLIDKLVHEDNKKAVENYLENK